VSNFSIDTTRVTDTQIHTLLLPNTMVVPAHASTDPKDLGQFEKDIKDVHLVYDYDAKDAHGNPEKWKYEMYFPLLHLYPSIF
jgi:hypothetical protein